MRSVERLNRPLGIAILRDCAWPESARPSRGRRLSYLTLLIDEKGFAGGGLWVFSGAFAERGSCGLGCYGSWLWSDLRLGLMMIKLGETRYVQRRTLVS